MKRFLIRILWFISPIVILLICIEFYIVNTPNAFNLKANYIQKHLDIEALILGSSHNQHSINPEDLITKTSNLAYSNQSVQIDSALFFHYESKLKDLKYLFLELDYNTLELINPSNYFRLSWYYKHHNIELKKLSLLNKLSLYSSSPIFFNNHLKERIVSGDMSLKFNDYGFITHNNLGLFDELNYDTISIRNYKSKNLGDFKNVVLVSKSNYRKNIKTLNSIISLAREKGVFVLLISNPQYKTFLEKKDINKDLRRKQYIDSLLLADRNIVYFNFENHKGFNVADFKDDDHLNYNGAKKFTHFLNTKLDSLKKMRY